MKVGDYEGEVWMLGDMGGIFFWLCTIIKKVIYGNIRKKNYDEWRRACLVFCLCAISSVSFAFCEEVEKFSSGKVKSGSFVKFFRR